LQKLETTYRLDLDFLHFHVLCLDMHQIGIFGIYFIVFLRILTFRMNI